MEYTNKTPVPEEVAKEHKKKMTKAQLMAMMCCLMAQGMLVDGQPYLDPDVLDEED